MREVLGDFYDSLRDAAKPIKNLSKRHLEALVRLKLRRDIVIVDSDKNLGLVVLDADDYKLRCLVKLGTTHHRVTLIYQKPLVATPIRR